MLIQALDHANSARLPQVERAKKCLDFAATIYILHLGMVTLLSSFPKTLAWCARVDTGCSHRLHSASMEVILACCNCRWGINGCGLVITAVLGEWLCVQRELQDIPLGSGGPDFHRVPCRCEGIYAATGIADVNFWQSCSGHAVAMAWWQSSPCHVPELLTCG